MSGPCEYSEADARGESRQCRPARHGSDALVLCTAAASRALGQQTPLVHEPVPAKPAGALDLQPPVWFVIEAPAAALCSADVFVAGGAARLDQETRSRQAAGGAVRRSV